MHAAQRISTSQKEIIYSLDGTGSMYTILASVRNSISSTANRLFDIDPGVRIGAIAHGDYIDDTPERKRLGYYLSQRTPLSSERGDFIRFINTVKPTGGCGPFAAYEHVLRITREFNWTSDKSKALVLIGDEPPHKPNDSSLMSPRGLHNPLNIDWRNEAAILKQMGVRVYGVQALNKQYASSFYSELAAITGGFHLTLDQFDSIVEILEAITINQAAPSEMGAFEDRLNSTGRMTRNLDRVISTLSGRAIGASTTFTAKYGGGASLDAVTPGRFQVLRVPAVTVIKDFVEGNYLQFTKGRGFYELTKSETVQDTKEIVIQDKQTGDMFTGRKARDMIGLPQKGDVSFTSTRKPWSDKYRVFIHSTSYTRKLMGDTRFLYEVNPD